MFKKALPFFLIVETPLHAGGNSELGIIDLPIQRERHTNFPKIEASSLRGCIRKSFTDEINEININNKIINSTNKESIVSLVFGPVEGDDHSGSIGFTDARLLLFPIKSAKNVFGWITCPIVLEQLRKDLLIANISDFPQMPQPNTVPENSTLLINNTNKVLFEEYTFEVKPDITTSKFAEWISEKIFPSNAIYEFWRKKIKFDLAILSNDDFRDFVTLSTDVITRIKIDQERNTVEGGALFTEEYLPTESILYSLSLTGPLFIEEGKKGIFKEKNGKKDEELIMEYFIKGLPKVLQIGGNATIGKGLVRTNICEG